MNIEDELFKDNGILKDNEGVLSAIIVDEEIDCIDCTFNNDECVQLDTEPYTYITLSRRHLIHLIDMIDRAESYYNENEE